MKRIHLLLGVQSLVAILVSINRLGTWTLGYVLPNDFCAGWISIICLSCHSSAWCILPPEKDILGP